MTLTNEIVRHFRDVGYLRLMNVIEPALIARLKAFIAAGRDPAEHVGAPKRYREYESDRALMGELISHRNLIEPVTALLGPNVVYVTNRHNQSSLNRPGSTETRLHRDILQWSRGLISVVVYLDAATAESGCTHLVPGSQYLPFVGVPQPDGGGTWMDEHREYGGLLDQAVAVPVPSGGALIFDALVFHAAGENLSNDTRASIVLGYRSVDELDRSPDQTRQVLVAGQWIYRGNDR